MNPICSVILPSYRRITRCEEAIKSVVSAFDNPSNLEICLRLQENDRASQDHIEAFKKLAPTVKVTVGANHGYQNGNLFFMEAIALAEGAWMWLLDDDVTVTRCGSKSGVDRQLKRRNVSQILLPRVHRLGKSEYVADLSVPFMLVPLRCWERYAPTLTQPIDLALSQVLRANGWKSDFLDVAVHHHRDSHQELIRHRST